MGSLFAFVATSVLISLAFAQAPVPANVNSPSASSEFDKKVPEFDSLQSPARMTEEEIAKAVALSMQKQCDAQGRCWLMGTDGQGSSWQVSFSAGVGSRNYSNGTTVINLGDEDRYGNDNEPYYGITITYRNYKCQSALRVSPAMKRLLETYQYAGVNEDGSIKRTFSPSELALFSLYATLNQKLETCRSTTQQ